MKVYVAVYFDADSLEVGVEKVFESRDKAVEYFNDIVEQNKDYIADLDQENLSVSYKSNSWDAIFEKEVE